MTILTDDQLEKKNTKNLLYIKRKISSQIYSIGYCDTCGEIWGCILDDEQDKKEKDYLERIKKILSTREHITRDKNKGCRSK